MTDLGWTDNVCINQCEPQILWDPLWMGVGTRNQIYPEVINLLNKDFVSLELNIQFKRAFLQVISILIAMQIGVRFFFSLAPPTINNQA